MTDIMVDTVASYLKNLNATHEICTAFGTTLTLGNNLFVSFSPSTSSNAIILYPYSGSPPNSDGQRQSPSVQIRVKSTSRATVLKTGQALINKLHMNTLNGKGKMFARDSSPIIFDSQEGEEWVLSLVNFDIKHIKL